MFIRLSYRFVTIYAFLDIRFLKVPRSEKKERWRGYMVSNYTLVSMIQGSIILVRVTTANVDDRRPV
ncbi:Mobile element protein [Candidatus Enterovibrio escicola]|uniref:Mobile element protein n=1 Tax=Candidatus Enterovibrio escicola TaxID=1927127 RepID=A0A2A5T2M2_9GAMM|nr:hypothetical protein [Candidatus Enterovibrio escacola]PCS22391.1 Mobile element protein [Candidatus Enterovibrio escacola]